MVIDFRGVTFGFAAAMLVVSGVAAAPPSSGPARGPGPPGATGTAGNRSGAPAAPAGRTPEAPSGTPQAYSTLTEDAAARARMHECGHQWSSMKRTGTTGVMTWKEFSATCLVVR